MAPRQAHEHTILLRVPSRHATPLGIFLVLGESFNPEAILGCAGRERVAGLAW